MFIENEIGFIYETPDHICFFGKKSSDILSLEGAFPQLVFKRLRQTHSDRVVSTSPHSINFSAEADGHYSDSKNLGLCISTADCLPVLIFSPENGQVFSIHAGWRGVANRIVPKALQLLHKSISNMNSISIFIGPHIGFQSFEIKGDAKVLLEKSSCCPPSEGFLQVDTEKSLGNLLSILKYQIFEFGIGGRQISTLEFDTKLDSRFHSYRRDKESSGRQISFIALK